MDEGRAQALHAEAMTPEQERALLQAAARGDRAAKGQLIRAHRPLVEQLAGRLAGFGVDDRELFDVGAMALVHAIDSSGGRVPGTCSFAAYAEAWICSTQATLVRRAVAGPRALVVRAVDGCGGATCECATFRPAPGLTLERFYEQLLADLARWQRRLVRAGNGGEDGLSDQRIKIWRLLVAATRADGTVELVDGKRCPWWLGRDRLSSTRKDVGAKRWTEGRRRDRPRRQSAKRPRFEEVPLTRDGIEEMLDDTALRLGDALERVDARIDSAAAAEALLALLDDLPDALRGAVQLELARREALSAPAPLTRAQRAALCRARRRLAKHVLATPALEHLHGLAARVLRGADSGIA